MQRECSTTQLFCFVAFFVSFVLRAAWPVDAVRVFPYTVAGLWPTVSCVLARKRRDRAVTAGHGSLTRLADYRDFFALCDGVSSLCAAGGAFPMAQTGPPLARADT